MNKNYIYLTFLMLVLAAGTIFINKTEEPKQIEPQQLLHELTQPTRYVSTDKVAEMIIQGDPALMLIDVRSEDEFNEYTLPGALNVPLEEITTEESTSNFGIPGTKVVFFSNDDIKADQTWVLVKRLGYDDIYVLKGGLNCWMETIIDPVYPGNSASADEMANYSFRKGAQQYFTGAGTDEKETPKVEIKVQRRKKKSVAAGGC